MIVIYVYVAGYDCVGCQFRASRDAGARVSCAGLGIGQVCVAQLERIKPFTGDQGATRHVFLKGSC